MKQLFLIITLPLFLVCQGQTKKTDEVPEIDYNDVTEINGLVYFKKDTTLVSGKVIRYNKKNKPNSYLTVSSGKADNFGWVLIKNKYEEPKNKVRRTRSRNVVNEAGVVIGSIEEPSNYVQMSEINNTSNNIQSNINSSAEEKTGEESYKDDLMKSDSILVVKDGHWEKHYASGKLESKGVYIEGKRDGLWEEFYENGQLKRKILYDNGLENGLWEQYYDNGQLWGKGHYKDGRTIGEWNYYDEKGKLLLTENYNK